MNFSFPESKEILVLAPHPDDEALGCAGTIMLLNQKGVSSTVVFITNGEKLYERPSPIIGEKRREEGLKASEKLGCTEPIFLNFPDGEVVRHIDRVYDNLFALIKEKKPDFIFSPSPIDYHEDHIATSRVVLKLLSTITTFRVSFYEIYSTLRFNYLIDITEVADQKRRIISSYRSSLYEKPEIYATGALGLNAQRAIFAQKSGYYEAFYMVEKNDDIAKIHDFLSYKDLYEAKIANVSPLSSPFQKIEEGLPCRIRSRAWCRLTGNITLPGGCRRCCRRLLYAHRCRGSCRWPLLKRGGRVAGQVCRCRL